MKAIIAAIIAIKILMREYGIDMGAGIPSLLWLVTQFYIINRLVLGEHLEKKNHGNYSILHHISIATIIAAIIATIIATTIAIPWYQP